MRTLLLYEFVLMIKKEETPTISVFQLLLVTLPLLRAPSIHHVMKKIPQIVVYYIQLSKCLNWLKKRVGIIHTNLSFEEGFLRKRSTASHQIMFIRIKVCYKTQ